mgnify:CR=1 FL=1
MKRKERHLTVMGWVVVGLLDTLAGVISGGLMALWQLPSTYRWRGYWAIGGEWILIVGAIIIASRLMHELQMQALFGGKKKNDKVRSVSQGHYRSVGNRSGVRREVFGKRLRAPAKPRRIRTVTQPKITAERQIVGQLSVWDILAAHEKSADQNGQRATNG